MDGVVRLKGEEEGVGEKLAEITCARTRTRPPCFEVEKYALRLRSSAHYLPTNLGPPPLRTVPCHSP